MAALRQSGVLSTPLEKCTAGQAELLWPSHTQDDGKGGCPENRRSQGPQDTGTSGDGSTHNQASGAVRVCGPGRTGLPGSELAICEPMGPAACANSEQAESRPRTTAKRQAKQQQESGGSVQREVSAGTPWRRASR